MFSISLPVLRKAVTFVLSFGLSKVGAFAAAVALPRFVSTETYGLIELSMTVAALAAAVIGLGAPGVAMRAFLLEDNPGAAKILGGHAMALSILGSGLGAGLALAGAPNLYVLCAAMLAFFGLQSSATVHVRMHGNVLLAGWFDAFALMATVVVTMALCLAGHATEAMVAYGVLVTGLAIAAATTWFTCRVSSGDVRTLLRQVIRGGIPMMLYALSITLLFGTPRMAIARGLGLHDVAVFSVCARVSAALLFANQVFQIGFVRYLYRLERGSIAKIFPYWTIALCLAAAALTVAGHFASDLLVAGTSIAATDVATIFPAIVCLTTLNILNANVEMYINRELASQAAAKVLVSIFAVLLAVGAVMMQMGWLTLPVAVALYSAAMAVALVMQMRILRRHGLSFGWSTLVLPLAAIPWLASFLPSSL
jgi:O-antigen/teichoic acid export membrane protein